MQPEPLQKKDSDKSTPSCRMKKYRIMGDVFRNRLRKYNRVTDIVSGLVNYRTLASSF